MKTLSAKREKVKQAFGKYQKQYGFELLAFSSKNNTITTKCPNGHVHRYRATALGNGALCNTPSCLYKGTVPCNGYDLKSYLTKRGYTISSVLHKNYSMHVSGLCPVGHKLVSASTRHTNRDLACIRCTRVKQLSALIAKHEPVIRAYEKKFKYKVRAVADSKSKLMYEVTCKCGKVVIRPYSRILEGRGCSSCTKIGVSVIWTKEKILEFFKKENYTDIVFLKFNCRGSRVEGTCPKGHRSMIRVSKFIEGHRCGGCKLDLQSFISKGERQVYTFCKKVARNLGLTALHNYRTIDPCKEVDVYFPELMWGIEYNGDFWHAREKKYGTSGELYSGVLIEDVQHKDKEKKDILLNRFGIRINVIWDTDWKANPDLWKSKIIKKVKMLVKNKKVYTGELNDLL